MRASPLRTRLLVLAVLAVLVRVSSAGDIRIPLPKRSHLTPVQRLNREGVDAVAKHQYRKARALFYKAYLYDPNDPFTLNNLGYIAELDGEVDRAQMLYELASQQATDAVIDRASLPKLKGESLRDEVASIHDQSMRISRANVGAVHLLSQGRGSEAEALLQAELTANPHNAFTLNNLGVAKEAEGDLESALSFYTQAAAVHSSQPVVVTFDRTWRGRQVSEMAAASAARLKERIRTEAPSDRAARLNARGVAAINRNDWHTADLNFRAAYTLDPNNAFSLNNVGYLSEMSGDPETAQFFYEKARQAPGANDRVGLATRQPAEGMKLFQVSSDSDEKVAARIAAAAAARRKEGGPIQLKRRDNSPVVEPTAPPPSALPSSVAPSSVLEAVPPPSPPVESQPQKP